MTAAGAALWVPVFRLPSASADDLPPEFPPDIEVYRQAFENWAKEIRADDVWTCAPRSADEVVTLANWARDHGFRLRPRGVMHGWSPFTVTPGEDSSGDVVLLDTTTHLNQVRFGTRDGTPTVTAGCGTLMDDLLQSMEDRGLGFVAVPAPGDITIGGALAIDGHGTGVPARTEQRQPGQTYGSLSNLVTSLEIVAFDEKSGRYDRRRVDRSHPLAGPLLVNLGRAFITEATLQAADNVRLRCVSSVDIPAAELFAPPGTPDARTVESLLDDAGRIEAIWYVFTDRPWMKIWSVSPERPLTSREVDEPYNYPFSDNIPEAIADLSAQMVNGNRSLTPLFGQSVYAVTAAGLVGTGATDLWGWSKNLLLYIKPTSLRVTANGYALVMRRDRVQQALHDLASEYTRRLEDAAEGDSYPISLGMEIRVTGIDDPADVDAVSGARAPSLSALHPVEDHPDRDTAVWVDLLTLPDNPEAPAFMRAFENWLYDHYASWATVRVEWSKGWAYTTDGAWTDEHTITHRIPASHGAGRRRFSRWDDAVRRLEHVDPTGVFMNDLLGRVLGRR